MTCSSVRCCKIRCTTSKGIRWNSANAAWKQKEGSEWRITIRKHRRKTTTTENKKRKHEPQEVEIWKSRKLNLEPLKVEIWKLKRLIQLPKTKWYTFDQLSVFKFHLRFQQCFRNAIRAWMIFGVFFLLLDVSSVMCWLLLHVWWVFPKAPGHPLTCSVLWSQVLHTNDDHNSPIPGPK